MDRFGGHNPLSRKRLEEDWKYLRAKYPQDFTVSPAQALAWHRREAESCVKEQNPAAALFHTLYAGDLRWALPWGLARP